MVVKMKEPKDLYVDVEIGGTTCKVRKLTPPARSGAIVAWKGVVDKNGKQIVFSEDNIKQVLDEKSAPGRAAE